MSINYFEKLAALARKLDEGIVKLQDAWEMPHVFIAGCAEITEETQEHVESLKKSLQSTQDDVNKLIKIMEDENNNMNCLIKEAQDIYDTVKQDVDDLETVFEEFGYRYNPDDDDNLESKESEKTQNSNCSNSMQEVVFTPDLSWHYKKKSIDTTISLNEDARISEENSTLNKIPDDTSKFKERKKAQELYSTNCMKELVFTPDLNCLSLKKSVQEIGERSKTYNQHMSKESATLNKIPGDTSKSKENKKAQELYSTNCMKELVFTPDLNCLSAKKSVQETGKCNKTYNQFLTPLRDRPQDHIYSKHFYSLLKQTSNKKP